MCCRKVNACSLLLMPSQAKWAKAASQGLVGYEDFEVRPIQRIGEKAKEIPA